MRRLLFAVLTIAAVAVGAAQTPSPNPPVFLYAAVGSDLSTYAVGASSGSLTKTSSVPKFSRTSLKTLSTSSSCERSP